MKPNEILQLLQEGEGQHLEFKKSASSAKDIAKEICAFANSKGGTLIIGVAEDGTIIGVRDPRKAEEVITNALNHNLFPTLDVTIEKLDLRGSIVIVLFVPEGQDKPYKANHITYLRIGSSSRPATYDEERRLYIECDKIQVDTLPFPKLCIEDLDMGLIRQYVARREEQSGERLNLSTEELLLNLDCAVEREGRLVPTIAGVLLFHQEPQRVIKQSDVECVRFKGKDVSDYIIDRKNYSQGLKGPLYAVVDQVEQFVIKHMNLSSKIVGFGRVEHPEYPIEAIREMIVNAVVHRDYDIRGQHIRIFMFDDRIEVYTPGGLPKGISLERIRRGESQSKLRNPVIMEVFKDLGKRYVEKLGTGIRKILSAARAHGGPDPFFDDTGTDFLIRFFSPGEKILERGKHPDYIKRTDLSHLNERQIEALRLMVNEGEAFTNRRYARRFNVTNRTALRDLTQLVEENLVIRKGSGKATKYVAR